MPFVPVANTALVVLNMGYYSQTVINTFWLKNASPFTPTTLRAAAQAVKDWVDGHYAGAISHDLVFNFVEAKDMTAPDGLVERVAFASGSHGGDTSQGMPGGTSLAVRHSTGFSGRSKRGRTYIVGIPEDKVDGNNVTPTYAGGIQTAYDVFLTSMATAGFTWVVASLYHGYTQSPPKYKKVPTPRSAGVTTPITANNVNQEIDSQRRRLAGRGA